MSDEFRPPYVMCTECNGVEHVRYFKVDLDGNIILPEDYICSSCREDEKVERKKRPSLMETWAGFAFILVLIELFDASKWITQGIKDLSDISLTVNAFYIIWFIFGTIHWLLDLFCWYKERK